MMLGLGKGVGEVKIQPHPKNQLTLVRGKKSQLIMVSHGTLTPVSWAEVLDSGRHPPPKADLPGFLDHLHNYVSFIWTNSSRG